MSKQCNHDYKIYEDKGLNFVPEGGFRLALEMYRRCKLCGQTEPVTILLPAVYLQTCTNLTYECKKRRDKLISDLNNPTKQRLKESINE